MAKKAAPKAEKPKATPKAKKEPKILKRRLSISGVGFFDVGTEVTADIEKAYNDYYKKITGGDPIRPLDWYC